MQQFFPYILTSAARKTRFYPGSAERLKTCACMSAHGGVVHVFIRFLPHLRLHHVWTKSCPSPHSAFMVIATENWIKMPYCGYVYLLAISIFRQTINFWISGACSSSTVTLQSGTEILGLGILNQYYNVCALFVIRTHNLWTMASPVFYHWAEWAKRHKRCIF